MKTHAHFRNQILKNLLAGGLVITILSFCPGQSDPADQISVDIDLLIKPLSESNNYAGKILVSKGEEIIHSQAYGKKDYRQGLDHDEHSRFFLCSGSMIFTSTAVMQLVDAGKLSLNDPVSTYIPDIKRGDEITIHHMLAQRSGIPAIGTVGGVGRAMLLNYTSKPHTPKELVEYVKDYDLLFDPGTDYNHGKSEYNILAYIIELVSGKTFGEYLRTSIFQPLNMYNTGHYSADTRDIEHLVPGHSPVGFVDLDYTDKIHWSSKTGHASIYSTAGDLYLFGNAVLQGKLLSKESWRKIFTDHGNGWGYGWVVSPQQGHKRRQINGRSPGYASYFGIYPDDELIIVMLSNAYISLPFFVGPQIASIALGEAYETLNMTIDPVGIEYAEKVKGTYQFDDFYRPGGKVKITYKDGRLYSDGNALIPVEKEGRIVKFINRHYWSSLTFIADSHDKINQLQFDDYTGTRILNDNRSFVIVLIIGLVASMLIALLLWIKKSRQVAVT